MEMHHPFMMQLQQDGPGSGAIRVIYGFATVHVQIKSKGFNGESSVAARQDSLTGNSEYPDWTCGLPRVVLRKREHMSP